MHSSLTLEALDERLRQLEVTHVRKLAEAEKRTRDSLAPTPDYSIGPRVPAPEACSCEESLALKAELASAQGGKDAAYYERNALVAFLARCFPSGVRKTAIEGWGPEWHGCVFIDTPEGQLSWHYHDDQAPLFADLPAYDQPWDGHSTPEKYARLGRLTTRRGQTLEAVRHRVEVWKHDERHEDHGEWHMQQVDLALRGGRA